MFLVPIKLEPFKFSPYLILIVFLVPIKKIALNISPYSIQICLIMLKLLSFRTIFCRRVKNITKSFSAKNYRQI